jgi:hypothetical protein
MAAPIYCRPCKLAFSRVSIRQCQSPALSRRCFSTSLYTSASESQSSSSPSSSSTSSPAAKLSQSLLTNPNVRRLFPNRQPSQGQQGKGRSPAGRNQRGRPQAQQQQRRRPRRDGGEAVASESNTQDVRQLTIEEWEERYPVSQTFEAQPFEPEVYKGRQTFEEEGCLPFSDGESGFKGGFKGQVNEEYPAASKFAAKAVKGGNADANEKSNISPVVMQVWKNGSFTEDKKEAFLKILRSSGVQ